MNIIVIDPAAKTINRTDVPTPAMAAGLHLGWPYCADDLTDDHSFMWSPLAVLDRGASFFWSRRLGDFFAGRALLFGLTVDGELTDTGHGMENALAEDLTFLGDLENTKRLIPELCKAGVIEL